MNLAIRAEGIYKTFRSGWLKKKEKEALKGVSFEVKEGEIFGVLGPNGAGKTTLLSILSTLLIPDRGQIEILGMDSRKEGHRIRQQINLSSGNANFLWSMTVEENLHFYGMLYGLTGNERKRRVEELINFLDMEDHREVSFDRLSTGMKQRLSLAKSLINKPSVLFLDEPTVGLDPSVSVSIRKQIQEIQRKKSMTILLTTHNMKEAEILCHRIAFLKEGKILTIGDPASLKRMVRLGDRLKIEFEGRLNEDELIRVEGVINYSISDGVCEILVDEGEKRLGSLISKLSQDGVKIKKVTMGQIDLEEVFLEFARSSDSDMGLYF
ncbi:MAG: ABC transporter ATP-binding protein [Thermodesulfobacteriota bacterium]